jgi:hypothetical protein
VPFLKYRGEFKPVITGILNTVSGKKLANCRLKDGCFGRDWKWDSSFNSFKISNPQGVNNKISKETLSLFDDFLDESVTARSIVFLVNPPSYYESQEYINNYDSILDIYRKYQKKDQVFFLDYSNLDLSRDTLYFYNSQHLNKLGSELFTKRLAEDIDSILSAK